MLLQYGPQLFFLFGPRTQNIGNHWSRQMPEQYLKLCYDFYIFRINFS